MTTKLEMIDRALQAKRSYLPALPPTATQLLVEWRRNGMTVPDQVDELGRWFEVSVSPRTLNSIHSALPDNEQAAA